LETIGFAARELRIERLDAAGQGIAEGGLRVPFALPGELVRGPVADGVLAPVEILEPAPERVTPPCRHFGTCGGCALQHASDAFLADWKRDQVVRALKARGLEAEMRPVAVSPPRSRRRAVLTGRRTKKTVLVGFHGRRSDQVVDMDECHVLRPELMAARAALADVVRAGASRAGALRMTLTASATGLDLAVEGGKPLDAGLRAGLAGIAEAHVLARLAWDGEPVAMRRPPLQSMGRARVVPPPGAFLQATREGEAALVAAVREAVGEAGGEAGRVADLFAGCGTFALPLAERAEVHAVEGAAPMLAALDAGWRAATGLRRVGIEARDLFRRPLQPAELARFQAVVVDPPRAGAEAQTTALAASGVGRVAMVSCNPVSFARDAALLARGGFRLRWVQVVDQFRWSGHVELAACFTR
jgi:23S rRNA (uracil1939-C5)-methyltransferase